MQALLEKLKSFGNQKKLVENLVIFLVLLVILIVVINTLFNTENKTAQNEIIQVGNIKETNYTDELEMKLKNILSKIEGAGKVDVMISYLSGIEQVPMYDMKESTTVTEEKDKSGGERKTEQKSNEQNVIYEEKNSTKSPVIKQTIMPEIIGVIIVAEGADNMIVKDNITKAVLATVNVPVHRIQVFSSQEQ